MQDGALQGQTGLKWERPLEVTLECELPPFLHKCQWDLSFYSPPPRHETQRGHGFNDQRSPQPPPTTISGSSKGAIEAFVFSPHLLALVESLAAVLLEILVSFFLGCACSRSCSCGTDSLCSMSELPPLVLGLSSGLCTSLDIVGP